jgi:LmbE family N-acetylglucosaminyl deacetylase
MAQSNKTTKRPASVNAKRKRVKPKAAGKSRASQRQALPAAEPVVLLHEERGRAYRYAHSRWLGRAFAVFSVLILLATTVYWSILSANLQRRNADQLIDPYLFESSKTFHQAIFPGAHSFLLKWPVFWLMQMVSYSRSTYVVATVALVVITLGALVAILCRILRCRLFLLGGFCLALASVLLLVPAQPGAGALLPVNMAMVATRNIEYVFLMGAIYGFVRSRSWRDGWFGLGLILGVLLIANDKLFAPLLIGGALVMLAQQFTDQLPKVDSWRNGRWLIGGVIATIAGSALLKIITRLKITTIANSTTSSPYPVVHTLKGLAEALFFGVGSVLTNFGANPVHAEVVIKSVPSALGHSLSYSTVAYLVNLAVLLSSLWLAIKLWRQYRQAEKQSLATRFALALCGASIASVAIYVLTDHYYPVDARYMTIMVFALFISAAVYMRQYSPRLRYVGMISAVLVVSIVIGIFTARHEYQQSQTALLSRAQLTHYIADSMAQYHVGTLIGNYWYVTPVKARSSQPLTVLPMADCRTPQPYLTSTNWHQAPHYLAVAYLAVKDSNGSTYDGCTAVQITGLYGTPTKRIVLAGASVQPDQLLLIYPQGVDTLLTGPRPYIPRPKVATPPKVDPNALANTSKCLNGMVLNIVAHEDDDLLFMSPDLLHNIRDGKCITTTYLTAGDAGAGTGSYAYGREAGAEAAYSSMYQLPNSWHQRPVVVEGHQVTAASLDGQPNVTLIFVNLPDGGVQGNGYSRSHRETLQGLRSGKIYTMHSIDGMTAYTATDLTTTLTDIMEIYQPDEVHTQDYSTTIMDGDHSDHHAAGYFAKQAYRRYSKPSVLRVYAGYPSKYYPVNIFGQDATDKEATFLEYAAHDPAVCQSGMLCDGTDTYGNYLTHQYSKLVDAHFQPK